MPERFSIADLIKKGYSVAKDGSWTKQKEHKYHAQKVEEGGVKYDSKRELAFKHLLDLNSIRYVMKQQYILQEKFAYMGSNVREISTYPDFTILKDKMSVAVVDVKGMIMPDFKLKMKLLKKKLFDLNHELAIFMPRNKKEMNETIEKLKELLK